MILRIVEEVKGRRWGAGGGGGGAKRNNLTREANVPVMGRTEL